MSTQDKIRAALASNPKITTAELSRQLNVARTTVFWHLQKLESYVSPSALLKEELNQKLLQTPNQSFKSRVELAKSLNCSLYALGKLDKNLVKSKIAYSTNLTGTKIGNWLIGERVYYQTLKVHNPSESGKKYSFEKFDGADIAVFLECTCLNCGSKRAINRQNLRQGSSNSCHPCSIKLRESRRQNKNNETTPT